MNIYSFPPLITALIALSAGIFVLLKSRRDIIRFAFVIFCFVTFWWQFSWVMLFNANDPLTVSLLIRVGYSGIIFIPITYFHFVEGFLKGSSINKLHIVISYFVGLFFLSSLWFSDAFIQGYYQFYWGFYPKANTLHLAYLLFLLFLTIRFTKSLVSHIDKVRNDPVKYNQSKYILIATGAYFFAVFDFAVNYGFEIYPFGFLFVLTSLGILAYAMFKYQLMDIRVAVTRASLFLIIYSISFGFPLFVGYQLMRWNSQWYIPLIIGVFLALLGPLAYHYIKNKAENLLLAQQRRYQRILLQISTEMAREHNLNTLTESVAYSVKRSVGLAFSAIYLVDKDNKYCVLKVGCSFQSNSITDRFGDDSVLFRFLDQNRKPFIFEELPQQVKEVVDVMSVRVIVPFISQDRLLGFMFLGEKLDKTVFAREDISALQTLSNQAALAIENCLYVEEVKAAQERIFAAEKLASIGGMAEGIAHQLANRLSQFALNSSAIELKVSRFEKEGGDITQKYPLLKEMIADVKKITEMTAENVERTNNMIKGIMNYASIEVAQRDFSTFTLQELVNPSVELLKIKHTTQQFPLSIEVEGCDGSLRGVKAQLTEALYNILDNAYEAIKEKRAQLKEQGQDKGFVPSIKIQMSNGETLNTRILKISDNGIGIKAENRQKIFAPFYTTKTSKKSGAGIGMYIVKRMIEEIHKGKISFKSEYGQGAEFQIRLPMNC